MSPWVESVLEIIKFTIPGLIVFLTAYFLLKKQSEKQLQALLLRQKQERARESLKFKLQAYERVVLFLERISIPQLLMRCSQPPMSAEDLKNTLLVVVQQEYEHNISQQVYLSESLWKIIKLARQNVVSAISQVAAGVDPRADKSELISALLAFAEKWDDPLEKAKQAVKKEASLVL